MLIPAGKNINSFYFSIFWGRFVQLVFGFVWWAGWLVFCVCMVFACFVLLVWFAGLFLTEKPLDISINSCYQSFKHLNLHSILPEI